MDDLRSASLKPPPLSRSESHNSRVNGSRGIVVFSGGSAANNLVDVFGDLASQQEASLSYVMPISDNGGSTSELIRVFGGPGIGDLRSRLVRLIPDNDQESAAIKAFFNYRLPSDYNTARHEWLDIVEANHALWNNISTPKKELIRSFLSVVNLEIVKRLRPSSKFDYSKAAIGNLFLTGARLFTGSLESAIYLLSSICGVPSSISILPAINTNFTHHISAGLADSSTITGQNDISHPSEPVSDPLSPSHHHFEALEQDKVEDANLPGTHPSLRKPAINFTKPDTSDHSDDLPSRISRIWYINPYGHEISVPANNRVVSSLQSSCTVIYSIGSLFTSIIPSLILRNIGEAIATSPNIRSKILILNGTNDRETGPSTQPFTAIDFVAAIAEACAQSRGMSKPEKNEYWRYVTHVVYLEGGRGAPGVDRESLADAGVEGIKIYGRKGGNGEARYDADALRGVLGMIVGRGDMRDRTRRNTLEH
ncbi:hypothetical protein MBLNU457_3927t1 [Dothideomycetes sp. NU457]